jgi:hypothetical protein
VVAHCNAHISPNHLHMKKYYQLILLLGLIISTWLSMAEIMSSGAPIGSTGAPNEETCGRVGCHVGENGKNNVNTGHGLITLEGINLERGYAANHRYNLSISIEDPNYERYGFAMVALDDTEKSIGDFVITDANRTQIMDGVRQFSGRNYITYRTMGTYPTEQGKSQWNFDWIAPSNYNGTVKFYLALVSADGDGTDKGDIVYTRSYSVNNEMNTPTGLSNAKSRPQFITISPNPIVGDAAYINYTISKPSFIHLYDATGRQVRTIDVRCEGDKGCELKLSNLEQGIYFIKAGNAAQSQIIKIYKQP